MQPIIYLNNQFLPKVNASISPDDRGFYFADGIYEVIRFYRGHPFYLEEHLARLVNSLKAVRIDFERIKDLRGIMDGLIKRNRLEKSYAGVYLQITRGSYPRTHHFPKEPIVPTLYAYAFEKAPLVEHWKKGIKVITRPDIRWLRCNIKSIALLPNTLLYQEAVENDADECILVRDGMVTEASHSNVLGIKNGKLYTHPDGNLVLPGITKKAVFNLCQELKIPVIEEPLPEKSLTDMDELMIVGTGNEILPVVKVNESLIGGGHPGPITRKLQQAFFDITYRKLGNEKDFWLSTD